MTDKSGPCVVCGTWLRSGLGRWQEGLSLYARLNAKTVRVGAACESHFQGEKTPCGWADPSNVRLIRPKPDELARTTGDRPYHGGRGL